MIFSNGTSSFIRERVKNLKNKRIFPLRVVQPRWQNAKHKTAPYDTFYSKNCSYNRLEADYMDFVNLLKSGLRTEQVVIKLKVSKPLPSGIEK